MIYNQCFGKTHAYWIYCDCCYCPPNPFLPPPKVSYILAYTTTLKTNSPDNFFMRPSIIRIEYLFQILCLSSKWNPLQAATKLFGAPFCSVWMRKDQQQQQHHEHGCVLKAILNNAASKSKSSSKVS